VHQNCAIRLTGRRVLAHAKIVRMATEAAAIAANIERVCERVTSAAARARHAVGPVKIVAISKTFSADALRAAYDAGLRDFGENRVQEWESKRAQLGDLADKDATWHMIGHVQGNKAARVAHLFHRVDSLDRLAVAQKLDSAAALQQKRLPVLIEVHLGGEESKTGVAEVDLAALAAATAALTNLDLQGLMTIPPYFEDVEHVRPYFRKLRELRDSLSARLGRALPVLSMGMSHDFEVAVEEGATEVRIGSAIFGAREQKA
jgi:PLP dependent protein